jgi:hypothetical protein
VEFIELFSIFVLIEDPVLPMYFFKITKAGHGLLTEQAQNYFFKIENNGLRE